jgi:guanylate kinase
MNLNVYVSRSQVLSGTVAASAKRKQARSVMAPLIILSGPSGSGKSTLIARLLAEGGWPLRLSVSVTTRAARAGEQDGVHYYYWPRQRFQQEVKRGGFLEWAEVFGNYYGTLKSEVEPHRRRGTGVLLDIDVKGWQQVKQQCPEATSIFIRTSSLALLEERLRRRGSESEEAIQRRLLGAQAELAFAPDYDHQVINDDLDSALAALRGIIKPLFQRGCNDG